MKKSLSLLVLLSLNFGILPALAYPVTWKGTAAGGNWSDGSSWSSGSAPGSTDSVALLDTAQNRVIIYDNAASGSLAGLSFTQTSAFENRLELRRSLTLSSSLAVAATSGTSTLFINAADATGNGYSALTSGTVFAVTGGVTVGSGGVLSLGRRASTSTSSLTYLSGGLSINGGLVNIQKAAKTSTGPSSFIYIIDGALTLTSGSLILGAATSNTDTGYSAVGDTRLSVLGDFTATGGTIRTDSYGYGKALNLNGATNSISSSVNVVNNLGVVLQSSGAQSLTSGVNIYSLTVSGTGTKTVSISPSTGGNVSVISLSPNTNRASTLRLGSDLVVRSGGKASLDVNGTVTVTIDTNGHTLDTTLGTLSLAQANNTLNISGDGTVKSTSINLSGVKSATVSGSTALWAVGGGLANSLSNVAGTISNTSKFIYGDASTSSVASTLESNRAIGDLIVNNGILKLTGATAISAHTVTVAAGAVLDVSSLGFTSPALTLEVNGATFGSILTNGLFDYSGGLTLDFDSVPAEVGEYKLFGDSSLTGNISSVKLAGGFSDVAMTNQSGIWSGASANYSFSFSDDTGILTVAAIPEPSPLTMMLSGWFVASILFLRHSRRSAF